MVAEAVQEPVVEETQGITPETPESIPEQPAVEQEEDYSSILAELVPDVTEETKDVQATADSPEAALEGLTPQQILELGEKRGAEKTLGNLESQTKTEQQQRREAGIRQTLATAKDRVKAKLTALDLSADAVLDVLADIDTVHGSHLALKDADIQASTQAAITAMKAALTDAGVKFTGDNKFEPGTSLDEYATKIAEHARKGYKSPAEVKDERKSAQIDLLKRLKAAGVEIPTERVPNVPAARAASTGLPTFAAFNALDITEQEKFTPEQRTRIYASDPRLRR